LYNYDKNYISQRATKFGFIRDTLEKVYRLADILEYINTDPILKGKLALKGGTAINLTIFNLPRLSVDIDLDYLGNDSRESCIPSIEEFENIRAQLDAKSKKSEEYFDMLQRTVAEFDNYKKRTIKEKQALYSDAVCDVVSAFLPVIDDIDRAIEVCKKEADGKAIEGRVCQHLSVHQQQ
jgi:predicted nucleotidyltransferase component of viral defense system